MSMAPCTEYQLDLFDQLAEAAAQNGPAYLLAWRCGASSVLGDDLTGFVDALAQRPRERALRFLHAVAFRHPAIEQAMWRGWADAQHVMRLIELQDGAAAFRASLDADAKRHQRKRLDPCVVAGDVADRLRRAGVSFIEAKNILRGIDGHLMLGLTAYEIETAAIEAYKRSAANAA